MPVVAAIPAIVGAAGSVAGGLLGRSAAGTAASQQAASQQKVIDLFKSLTAQGGPLASLFQGQTNNLSPYLSAGANGVNSLMSMVAPGGDLTKQFSFDPSQIQNDQGYQFMLQQGNQALQRAAATRGVLSSPGTAKAMTQYSQGLASNEYNNAYNRALTTFQTNRANTMQNLNTMLGVGQFGTSQFNQASQNYGGQQLNAADTEANAITGQGNAQAAGTIGQANAMSSMFGGLTNAAQTYSLGRMMQPQGVPQNLDLMGGLDFSTLTNPALSAAAGGLG